MFAHILQQMQAKVRSRYYVVTLLAEEEMENNTLTIFDVENGILTGEIIEREKDEDEEWKYLVRGQTLTEEEVIVVVKLSSSGKLVIITTETAYRSSFWSRIRAFWGL